ncbi:hypothetical protein [Cohnella candidum]|uniref:Uncharacterized protein n=1 Tax=Cohnella candidum TaxID=2674991 RepID=A0A3G3K069_9BACL|nr:hypothetical protein [Cohnella candidum]AYQ73813.1 hypothetical protein EAV92_15245 [Cohnella candidum]
MNICTWIHEGEGSRESDWRCAAVFFATSRRHNPLADHILFTDASSVPRIRGFDLERFLIEELKVRIERVPLSYRSPFGFQGMRKSPFYLFDVIKRIASPGEDEEAKYAVFHPDCVWLRPASIVESQLERYGLLTMATEDAVLTEAELNSISRLKLREIYREMLGETPVRVPEVCGSECFAATVKEARKLMPELERVWSVSLERFRRNRPRLADEEQMLGFAYARLGYPPRTANPFIKRIRTSPDAAGNEDPDDLYLTVWHLPDETDVGFVRVYRDVVRGRTVFRTAKADAYRRYLSRAMGVRLGRRGLTARGMRNLVYRKLRHIVK